jgi:hypothetical protein
MYEKFFEQAESVMKPLDRIFAINMQTLDDWREKQTAFFNDLMEKGINYSRDLPEQRDFQSLLNWQQSYWESVQEKFSENAKESFALLSEAQEKLIGLYEDSLASAGDFAERATSEARSNITRTSRDISETTRKAKRAATGQAKKVAAEARGEATHEPEPQA